MSYYTRTTTGHLKGPLNRLVSLVHGHHRSQHILLYTFRLVAWWEERYGWTRWICIPVNNNNIFYLITNFPYLRRLRRFIAKYCRIQAFTIFWAKKVTCLDRLLFFFVHFALALCATVIIFFFNFPLYTANTRADNHFALHFPLESRLS